jgi:hypothetical protein
MLNGPYNHEFVMSDATLRKRRDQVVPSGEQTAQYTYERLVSLKRLAEESRLARLALLIEQAAEEAHGLCQKKRP